MAWAPYGLLVLFVLLWGFVNVKAMLDQATIRFAGRDWMIR